MNKTLRISQVLAACGLLVSVAAIADSSSPRRPSTTSAQSASSTKKVATRKGSKRVSPGAMRGRAASAAPSSPAATHISQRVRSVSTVTVGGRKLAKVPVNRSNSIRRLSVGDEPPERADDGPDRDTTRADAGGGSRLSVSAVPNARRVLRRWATNARDEAARRDTDTINDAFDRQTTTAESTDTAGGESTPRYPPNRGFDGEPTEITLEPGTEIDRFGSQGGRYTSPVGTPYSARALPPGSNGKPYSVYRIERPVTVQAGRVLPFYGEAGGGTQYYMPTSMANLVSTGAVTRVQQPRPDQGGERGGEQP